MLSMTACPHPPLPRNFIGKWRMNIVWEFKIDGKIKTEHFRQYADVVEL